MSIPLPELLRLELDRLDRAYSQHQLFHRLPTGLLGWDMITGGLARGAVHLLSGPPRSGVTSLAVTVASNVAAQHGEPVLLVTRLAPDEVARRLWSAQSLVPVRSIRSGRLGHDGWRALTRSVSALSRGPLRVLPWTDTPTDPVRALEGQCGTDTASIIVLDDAGCDDVDRLRHLARHHDLAVLIAHPESAATSLEADLATTATRLHPDPTADTTTRFAIATVHENQEGDVDEFPLAFLEEYLTWVDIFDVDTPRLGSQQVANPMSEPADPCRPTPPEQQPDRSEHRCPRP